MPRSQNSVASRTRKKRVLKKAKGFWGSRGTLISIAKHAVDKAGQYAFRDRRVKKRTFRALWITRINAAARLNGLTYSTLMAGIKVKGLEINRKVLAELAVSDPKSFSKIANLVNEEK